MTLALVGWLLCIAVIIVAATAVGVQFDRAPDLRARRVRLSLGIEPAAEAALPVDSGTLPPVMFPAGPSAAPREQDDQARPVEGGSAWPGRRR